MKMYFLAFLAVVFLMGCAGFYAGHDSDEKRENNSLNAGEWYFDGNRFEISANFTKLNGSSVRICGILEYTGEKAYRIYFGDKHPFTIHIHDYARNLEIKAPLIRLDILTEKTMNQGDAIVWCRAFELPDGEYRVLVTAEIQIDCKKKLESGEVVVESCRGELKSDEVTVLINSSPWWS